MYSSATCKTNFVLLHQSVSTEPEHCMHRCQRPAQGRQWHSNSFANLKTHQLLCFGLPVFLLLFFVPFPLFVFAILLAAFVLAHAVNTVSRCSHAMELGSASRRCESDIYSPRQNESAHLCTCALERTGHPVRAVTDQAITDQAVTSPFTQSVKPH